jgi:hypothetical protein
VQTDPGADLVPKILSRLSGTSTGRLTLRAPTLEDAYVELVAG